MNGPDLQKDFSEPEIALAPQAVESEQHDVKAPELEPQTRTLDEALKAISNSTQRIQNISRSVITT